MEMLSGTFDNTNALSYMFLWLIFGILGSLVNCDIQRFMRGHPAVFHGFGFLAFFFLFTLLDSNNSSSIWLIWVKSIFVYVLFVLMTKSKWYFVLPVLALLLFDQSVKKQLAFQNAAKNADDSEHIYPEVTESFRKTVTLIVNIAIIILILAGVIDYARIQKMQHGSDFSFYSLLLTTNACSSQKST